MCDPDEVREESRRLIELFEDCKRVSRALVLEDMSDEDKLRDGADDLITYTTYTMACCLVMMVVVKPEWELGDGLNDMARFVLHEISWKDLAYNAMTAEQMIDNAKRVVACAEEDGD